MSMLEIGKQIFIQSYKHKGSLHRTWAKGTFLEETDEYYVLVTYKTLVSEANGRVWQTREPALCFFYKHCWFNVISMIRKNGVTYYCNLASPSLIDEEALKNIDYDLDLKVYPSGDIVVLDEDEFERHKVTMQYSKEIVDILEHQLDVLAQMAYKKEGPFDPLVLESYYHLYLGLDREKLKKYDK